MTTLSPSKVVIVGAGVGGLTLAAALVGCDVTVVEKRPEIAAVGAGLMLHDRALQALASVGVNPPGRRYPRLNLGLADGRRLPAPNRGGLAVRRSDLHTALMHAAQRVDIRLSTTVTGFVELPDGVRVQLSDGTEQVVDYVVGADGLGSGVRALHTATARRRYSGVTCWRGIAEGVSGPDEPIELWGRGRRVGLVPLRDGVYIYLTESAPSWSVRSVPPTERFADFAGNAPALINTVPASNWHHADIEELNRHVWGTDRVPLLGDAAHGFTPNLGEGACQAILDAKALSAAIRGEGGYPGARRFTNARIAILSRWIGRVGQLRGKPAVVRDGLLGVVSKHP